MSKKLDYSQFIDKEFNRLTVIGIGSTNATKNNTKQKLVCLCACGKTVEVTYYNLKYRNTKSCGCLRSEMALDKVSYASTCAWAANTLSMGARERNNLFNQYVGSAKKRGFEFNLNMEDFEYFTQKPCHYCRLFRKEKTVSGWNIRSGLDRKDSSLGYTVDNVLACCSICNYAKRDMKYTDFLKWISEVSTFHTN